MTASPNKASLELTLHDLNQEGQGVGRAPEGYVVFVEGGLPGETVRVSTTVRKKTYATAKLEEILKPSPGRVEPFCPVFERCGGCSLQHFDHASQVAWKQTRLVETMRRVGGVEIPMPESLTGINRQFRSTLRLVCSWFQGALRVGFYATRSHELIAIESCPVSEGVLSEALAWVVAKAPKHPALFKKVVALALRSSAQGEVHIVLAYEGPIPEKLDREAEMWDPPACVKGIHGAASPPGNRLFPTETATVAGAAFLKESRMGFEDLRLGPLSFLQAHRQVHDTFLTELETFAKSLPPGFALDLFSGSGLSSLLLARAGHQVLGVEVDLNAFEDAEANALDRDLDVSFVRQTAEGWLESYEGPTPGLVFLNPPKKGLTEGGAEKLAFLGAPWVVYQSCHPASLARDVAALVKEGYKVERSMTLDFFPHTPEVEGVLFLKKG